MLSDQEPGSALSATSLISAREHYLSCAPVDGFCRYLAQFLGGRLFDPVYTTETLRPKAFYCIAGLEDAYEQFLLEADNKAYFLRMQHLRDPMLKALAENNNTGLHELIVKLYEGRLISKNSRQWLHENEPHLCELIAFACEVLKSDSPEPRLFGVPDGPGMSAFLSRIYAIMIGNFIAYESRIVAALCLFIREYCRGQDMDLPKELSLGRIQGWGKGKKDNGRNASWERGDFFSVDTLKRRHQRESEYAFSNIKASWMVNRAVELARREARPAWLEADFPVRRIEAALYMMGAKLPSPEHSGL
ncbi:MAG TPA: hypothetical protein IAC66_03720 [Candidatus Aphodousia gallistercoris]|nr:hypothetical protein [Candidatus Aphodousia gallistercoris]